MTEALAATEAWWEPGTRHSYHTNTYGFLVGEIAAVSTGHARPGCAAVAEPLDADVWFGLPDAEQRPVCRPALGRPRCRSTPPSYEGDQLMTMLSYFNPPGFSSAGVVNTPEWRRAQIPATNGHGTGVGVARVYAALLEPGRMLSPELLAEATRPQSEGFCPTLGEEVTFGLGFKPTTPRRPFGPNPRSFGHFGTGGALGFADPDAGLAFGYVMNDVIPRWQSTRNRALIDAVYASLADATQRPTDQAPGPSADQAETELAVRPAPVLDDLAVADPQDRGAVDLDRLARRGTSKNARRRGCPRPSSSTRRDRRTR